MESRHSSGRYSIDTKGWSVVRRKTWHQDERYVEVWVTNDGGYHWHMLGMERWDA